MAASLIALAVACGGATAPIPDPGTSSGSSGSSSGASSSGASSSGAGSSGSGRSCTEIGCANGFDIVFSYNTPGDYLIELRLDGEEVFCKASLPLRGTASACERPDVLLTTVGSALPASQQSIGGIHLTNTTVKKISIKVQRDNTMVATGSWDPIPYVTRPGPNGPGCPPETCTSGSVTLLER